MCYDDALNKFTFYLLTYLPLRQTATAVLHATNQCPRQQSTVQGRTKYQCIVHSAGKRSEITNTGNVLLKESQLNAT